MIKRVFTVIAACLTLAVGMAQISPEPAKVYFTSEITPESLLSIFNALGVTPAGNVAVKISTGESAQSNHLRPELIGSLVKDVKGTLVECNTAYGGNRSNTASHRRAIEQRAPLLTAKPGYIPPERTPIPATSFNNLMDRMRF